MFFGRASKQNADDIIMAGIKMKISYMEVTREREREREKPKTAQFVYFSSCFELKRGSAVLCQQSANTKKGKAISGQALRVPKV